MGYARGLVGSGLYTAMLNISAHGTPFFLTCPEETYNE